MLNNRYVVVFIDGGKYDPWSPSGIAPSPETIAHGLANLCRYGGHVTRFYSVAEHSIWIALCIACEGHDNENFALRADMLAKGEASQAFLGLNSANALIGLTHDCPEAAGLVDLPSPIGRHIEMQAYKDAHDRCANWLSINWGVPQPPWPIIIKETDHSILGAETAVRPGLKDGTLGNGETVPPWPRLDLAGRHDLSRFGTAYVREAWINAFYSLKNSKTNNLEENRTEESRARRSIALSILRRPT